MNNREKNLLKGVSVIVGVICVWLGLLASFVSCLGFGAWYVAGVAGVPPVPAAIVGVVVGFGGFLLAVFSGSAS